MAKRTHRKASTKRRTETTGPSANELALRLEAETLRARHHLSTLLARIGGNESADVARELAGIATVLHNVDSVASFVRHGVTS